MVLSRPPGRGGGAQTGFEILLTQELEVLAIVMAGGRKKCYPVFRGGGGAQNVSDPRFSYFVAPPSL